MAIQKREGHLLAAKFALGCGFLSALLVLQIALTKKYYPFFKFMQNLIVLGAAFLVTYALGGCVKSGFCIIWGLIAPMFALFLYTRRQALLWFCAFLASVLAVSIITTQAPAVITLSLTMLTIVSTFNIFGVSLLVFVSLTYFISQRDIERSKSDLLLLNVLPKEIADILRNDNRIIADRYDSVSILFADVVGFTHLSATMSPSELVSMLDEVFTCFDELSEKYHVEKIKTIGDCYMVASGVPNPQKDHAHLLAHMAIDIRELIKHRLFGGHRLTFRIGINSGTVVAGVIGRKKFIYDLWGDTVNTASRMESHGMMGDIQITEESYMLLKDDFTCKSRGTIDVKGKGQMRVWSILDQKPTYKVPMHPGNFGKLETARA